MLSQTRAEGVMKIPVSILRSINAEIFRVSLFLYIVLILLEDIRVGFVSNFMNMNMVFWLVLLTGIFSVVFPEPASSVPLSKSNAFRRGQPFLAGMTAILGTLFVFLKLQSYGTIGFLISILAGFIIALFILLFTEDDHLTNS